MNSSFNYKLINFFIEKKKKNEGFTLPELIVSGFISLLVLLAGFTFLRMNLNINKSDETNVKLAANMNNALDFIVDEINSSKKVIVSKNDINPKCKPLPQGDLVLALKIPDQAKNKDAYQSNNMNITSKTRSNYWVEADCPIFYNLVRDNSSTSSGRITYILKRYGPTVNQQGFYNANEFKTSVVLDKIRNKFDDDIICRSPGKNKVIKKQVKGIVLCVDEYGRGAEIMINAESLRNNNLLTTTKSSGGYSMINDEDLISNTGGGGGIIQNGCQFFNTCIRRKKITFYIDISGSMRTRHKTGVTLMALAKERLISQIKDLPLGQDFFLQVYKYNGNSYPVFRNGPQRLNAANKTQAIRLVEAIPDYPRGGTNPFGGLQQSIKDANVNQIIILSDGITRGNGYCQYTKRYMEYSDCFNEVNKLRETTTAGNVAIDTISLGFDFCSGNVPRYQYLTRYGYNLSWLGELSTKNNGSCTHVP